VTNQKELWPHYRVLVGFLRHKLQCEKLLGALLKVASLTNPLASSYPEVLECLDSGDLLLQINVLKLLNVLVFHYEPRSVAALPQSKQQLSVLVENQHQILNKILNNQFFY